MTHLGILYARPSGVALPAFAGGQRSSLVKGTRRHFLPAVGAADNHVRTGAVFRMQPDIVRGCKLARGQVTLGIATTQQHKTI